MSECGASGGTGIGAGHECICEDVERTKITEVVDESDDDNP